MTALQIARDWHRKYVPERTFEIALEYYLLHGLVHVTPEIFLCAEELHWDGEKAIMDKSPNAWFVYMAAATGTENPVREMVRVAPRPQPFVVWSRNNNGLRVYRHEHLARKVGL
jgi:hypothetical protein